MDDMTYSSTANLARVTAGFKGDGPKFKKPWTGSVTHVFVDGYNPAQKAKMTGTTCIKESAPGATYSQRKK